MAEIQDILNSGDLTGGYFGDTSNPGNRIAKYEDVKTVIGAARLATPYDVVIAKPDWAIAAIDELVAQTGDIVVDLTAHTITVNTDGYYKFTFSFNGFFAGNDDMKISPFLNGSAVSAEPIIKSGEGNNDNIVVTWTSIVNLNAGDVIDLRVGNNDTSQGNINLRIKHLFLGVELLK